MKTKALLCCLLGLGTLHAQNHLVNTATKRFFDVVRANLEGAADMMPADKYSFRLTEGQRPFAEWLIHSIQRNYSDCAVMKGVPTPEAEKQAPSLKGKEEVSKALKDSFAYCAEALQNFDDQKAISSDRVSYAFLHLVAHSNEIYGNVVGYLRASGFVPPSTASRETGKKKS